MTQTTLEQLLTELTRRCHANSLAKGFWKDKGVKFYPEKIALIHSELSEALEELRKPHPSIAAVEEEFADTIIRILDLAGHMNLNLGMAICNKMRINEGRPYKHNKRF